MSALAAFGGVLAWPDGSGVAGGVLLGAPAYVHTHLKLNRHHRERLAASGADVPVRAGAGSNPAAAGLPADGRVVPPAAPGRM